MMRFRSAQVVMIAVGLCALTACAPAGGNISDDLDADTRQYLEDNATSMAEQMGISDPPKVDLVRMITLEEWQSTQIECLTEAGYDVGETTDGQGIKYPEPTDDAMASSLNLAIYTCEMKYPVEQKYMAPLSTDQLEELYAYRTGELLECLEDEGYPVSDDPPSETVFIQSKGAWSPYESISIAQNDAQRVNDNCPQTLKSIYGD